MTRPLVEAVADAVLYEGYVLYPYRPSSVKNRQRWTFGGVYPRAYSEAQTGADAWQMQTECLVVCRPGTTLSVRVRFLHLLERRPREGDGPAWQEATEREVRLEALDFTGLLDQAQTLPFAFDAGEKSDGDHVRRHERIEGEIEVLAGRLDEGLAQLTLHVRNLTPIPTGTAERDLALRHTLVSTHAILCVQGGEFVSLFDPPAHWKAHADACRNVGTWPVLAGEEGGKDVMLSSPIILYDHPQVAPESPGDLFDATEIDEILTLRIMTLTDEEKRQAYLTDERTRRLLERTEALGSEHLLGLHGAVRSLRPLAGSPSEFDQAWQQDRPVPEYTRDDGVVFRPGDRVRLAPAGRADVFDLALAGRTAILESIEQDLEGRFLFAVTVEDDPGRDLGAQGKPGHRFFYTPAEVVPIPPEAGA